MKHLYQLLLVSVAMVAACCAQAQSKQPAAPDDVTTSVYKKNGSFAPNLGQVVDENYQPVTNVLAKSSLPGLDIYLTQTGVTYVLLNYELDSAASVHPVYQTNNNHFKVHYSRVDVNLVGATLTQSQLVFGKPDSYKASYYYGDIKAEAVSQYKDVTLKNVYPGIDWHWFINSAGQPEYDFVVHAGYSSSAIKMQYQYADITPGTDNILISTRNGALREGTLKAFAGGSKVQAAYTYNKAQNEVTFNIGSYNTATDLVIDPPLTLQWSAQYGGTFADGLRGVATTAGNVFLAGYTTSVNFPVYRPSNSAYFDSTFNGTTDVIVLKVSDTQNLLWATYAGGPGNDFANSISYNVNYNSFAITGGAQSGYPTTYNSSGFRDTTAVGQDIFVTCFAYYNLGMTLSAFYGGNGVEEGLRILYKSTDLVVTGYTGSGASFPVQSVGSYTRLPADGFNNPFILKFFGYSTLSLQWASALRDTVNAYGTALDIDNNHLVVGGFSYGSKLNYFGGTPSLLISNGGADGFITHFSQPGVPEFERFLGGSGNDYITDLAAVNSTSVVATGYTNSVNFPVLHTYNVQYQQPQPAGGYDAFITLFENDSTITWSTYYGGAANDAATGIAVFQSKFALTGFTFSTDFPVDSAGSGGYFQPINKGNSDGFIASFTWHGIRTYSTYKGDSCYEYPADIAITNTNMYVCGEGLFACNQSLPDSVFINGGGGSSGFCWAFGSVPANCLSQSASVISNICPDTLPGPDYGVGKVSYSGGVAPYNVNWSSGETTDTAYMLTLGTNFVIVQDGNGCAAETNLNVANKFFIPGTSAGNCFTNGSASAGMSGGNPPYRYLWSTGDTVKTISVLPGVYTATVTDSTGCVLSGTVTVPTLATENYSIEVIKRPGCSNSNGILVARLAGYIPYVVSWYNSNNQYLGTNDTLYNVPAGTYYIDVFVCQNNQAVHPAITLTDPGIQSNIQLTVEQVTVAGCFYPTGLVKTKVSGSTYKPYTYQWSSNQQQSTYYNPEYSYVLVYGNTYTVTVTDSVGCTATASITATHSDSILVDPIIHAPFCFNDNDGYIDPRFHSLGGGGNYSVYWEGPGVTPSNHYSPILDSAVAGTYTIHVTDANSGCEAQFSWDLALWGADHLTIESQPVGCNSKPAYAKVNLVNPVPLGNVYYTWRGENYNLISETDSISNIPSGHYYVTVSSVNPSGTYQACVYIGQETNIPSVTIIEDTSRPCYRETRVKAIVSGGLSPYIYAWNNDQNSFNNYAIASASGISTVQVTDFLGCRFVDTAAIHLKSLFWSTIQEQNWCNANLTNLKLIPFGGYPPYSGDTGVHTFAPGAYSIVLHDSSGCTISINVTVASHPYLQASYVVSSTATCISPGTITISASGGTAPYAGVGTFNLYVGSNMYVVTDSTGCKDTIYVTALPQTPINSQINKAICVGSSYFFNGQSLSNAGTYSDTLTTANGCDSIITLQLTVADVLTSSFSASVCNGNSYTFNNQQLTLAGTYNDTLIASGGCDSIVTLNLTVLPVPASNFSVSVCNGYSYTFNNQQLTQAGNYTDTLTAINGCDSIVTLNLTVLPVPASSFSASVCNGYSYTFNNQQLTQAGNYTDTLTTINGCDSIVTLNLTVLPVLASSSSASVCNGYSYTFNNQQLTQAGSYIDTLTATTGCDSIVTLNLTVLQVPTSSFSASVCNGYSYTFINQQLTLAGTYIDTLTTINGCDSIVTLNLTVLPELTGTISDAVCDGDVYVFNNQQLTQAGAYTDTLQGINGCDSLVTLILYTKSAEFVTVDTTIQQGTIYTLPGGSTTAVAGTYTDTLVAINGCDSIITTNLTVIAGIGNSQLPQSINIYPNPASTALYISTTLQLQTITVYNATGQQVMVIDKPQHLAGSNNYKLNIELLAAGTYVLQLTSNNTQLRQRWVKL